MSDIEEPEIKVEDIAADIHEALLGHLSGTPSVLGIFSPIVRAGAQLKTVLERWKEGVYYEPMSFPPLVVCNPSDSGMPIEHFVTRAAQKVGGFLVYRAAVELRIDGRADDTQEAYNARRQKDGFSEHDWDYQTQDFAPSIVPGDGSRRRVTLSKMRPVGSPAQKTTLGGFTFEVVEGCLSPKTLFNEATATPDVFEYEGFLDHNGPGRIEKIYRRDALAILLERDKPHLILAARGLRGVDWALGQLRDLLSKPTGHYKGALDATVRYLRFKNENTNSIEDIDFIYVVARDLLEFSLKWKDPELWEIAAPLCSLLPHELAEEASKALLTFDCSFADIQTGVDDYLDEIEHPIAGIKTLMFLHGSCRAICAPWLSLRMRQQLEGYTDADRRDIPLLIRAARWSGLKSLESIVIDNASKDKERNAGFIRSLEENIASRRAQMQKT